MEQSGSWIVAKVAKTAFFRLLFRQVLRPWKLAGVRLFSTGQPICLIGAARCARLDRSQLLTAFSSTARDLTLVSRCACFYSSLYPVEPQRTVMLEDFVDPVGVRIDWTAELEGALAAALAAARQMTSVDPPPRHHPDAARALSATASWRSRSSLEMRPRKQSALLALARRLSMSMDEPVEAVSLPGSSYRENASTPRRRVALWIFPRTRRSASTKDDRVAQRHLQPEFPAAKARPVRRQPDSHPLLRPRVSDFQAAGVDEVARFWIDRFLDASAQHQRRGRNANHARTTITRESPRLDLTSAQREQLQAAAIAVRTMPRNR